MGRASADAGRRSCAASRSSHARVTGSIRIVTWLRSLVAVAICLPLPPFACNDSTDRDARNAPTGRSPCSEVLRRYAAKRSPKRAGENPRQKGGD
jgi:hypothetical protein